MAGKREGGWQGRGREEAGKRDGREEGGRRQGRGREEAGKREGGWQGRGREGREGKEENGIATDAVVNMENREQ